MTSMTCDALLQSYTVLRNSVHHSVNICYRPSVLLTGTSWLHPAQAAYTLDNPKGESLGPVKSGEYDGQRSRQIGKFNL